MIQRTFPHKIRPDCPDNSCCAANVRRFTNIRGQSPSPSSTAPPPQSPEEGPASAYQPGLPLPHLLSSLDEDGSHREGRGAARVGHIALFSLPCSAEATGETDCQVQIITGRQHLSGGWTSTEMGGLEPQSGQPGCQEGTNNLTLTNNLILCFDLN